MCIKKNHRAFAFNSHVVAFLNSLQSTELWIYILSFYLYLYYLFYTKKRHENVCIQRIATSLLILKKQKKNRLNL